MLEPRPATGWWGYAEVDRVVVGAVVAIIVVACIIFLVRRLWRR